MSDETREKIAEAILQTATNPLEIESDAGRVRQHSLRELMELAKFQAEQDAAKQRGLPLRIIPTSLGGTTGRELPGRGGWR